MAIYISTQATMESKQGVKMINKYYRKAEKSSKPFPQILRSLLQDNNQTQDELAKAISKSRQAVSLYCNGSEPDYETLVMIAEYFGVTVDYLVGKEVVPTHDASSIVEQAGLSKEAVSILLQKADMKERAILLSDLLCTNKLDILTDSYLTWCAHAIQKIQFSGVAEASFDCDIREKFYKDLLLEDFAKCIDELYEKMERVYGESKT